jgi:hypothetical protein
MRDFRKDYLNGANLSRRSSDLSTMIYAFSLLLLGNGTTAVALAIILRYKVISKMRDIAKGSGDKR